MIWSYLVLTKISHPFNLTKGKFNEKNINVLLDCKDYV